MRVLICLVIEAENSMYVCVCGKLRALSHDQSDAKLRIGVTGCFTIIFIFMHAESITEEDEILERLLPGPGVGTSAVPALLAVTTTLVDTPVTISC